MAKASRRAARPAVTTDATAEFFDELARRGHVTLLQKATGSVAFEIVQGRRTDRWMLTIDKGDIAVSRRRAAADCLIRAEKALFDRVATGNESAVAAVLRGDLAVTGDWRFLVLIQRLFPGPPASRRRRAAGYARRQS
jgi:putative sterol carrier protein